MIVKNRNPWAAKLITMTVCTICNIFIENFDKFICFPLQCFEVNIDT